MSEYVPGSGLTFHCFSAKSFKTTSTEACSVRGALCVPPREDIHVARQSLDVWT